MLRYVLCSERLHNIRSRSAIKVRWFLAAVILLLFSLLPAHSVMAAFDVDVTREPLVNPRSNWTCVEQHDALRVHPRSDLYAAS